VRSLSPTLLLGAVLLSLPLFAAPALRADIPKTPPSPALSLPADKAAGPTIPPAPLAERVALGIDVVERDQFRLFQGKRIGLVTNQTGVDGQGRKTRVVLKNAPGVKLVRLYAPEHGIDGTILAGKYVASRTDDVTGLPVYSLYDDTRKPTPRMLQGIDMLVYDMQDIGARSYTFISTMVKCMEACAENGVEFVVLDRPNPLGGRRVEGPPVETRWMSFVGQMPVPYVHGLTVGEAARMANDLGWTSAKCRRLTIVPMVGWRRDMVWQDTGLKWVQTSPNIPYATSPVYYVVTGIVGSLSGINIGVGTPTPFQIVYAPNFPAAGVAAKINGMKASGMTAEAVPNPRIGWPGLVLRINPKTEGNLCLLAVYLLREASRSSDLFEKSPSLALNLFFKVYGSASIRDKIEDRHESASEIAAAWQPGVNRFREQRAPYLLYQ